MSYEKVRSALATSAVAILKAAPISLTDELIISGNMPSPKENAKWAQILFTTQDPIVATMGGVGTDLVQGVFFVNLRIPLDQGEQQGVKAIDAFRTALPAGSRVTFGGQEVTVLSIGAVDGRVVDGYWRTDITIPFRAFINRGA